MTRVIIVDDEMDWVEVLKDYLEMKDVEVIAAGYNGQDAIDLCKNNSADFLLLDLSMPEFDGFYALENINKLKIPIKIIVLTGLLTESNQKRLENFKIFSTIIKPVNPATIIECMQK